MMWLSEAHAQAIIAHARADAPREACGIIIGHNERATDVIPVPNIADDPLHTYIMDEQKMVAILSSLNRRDLELVGFYHSHPNSDPIPSPTDIRQATYPDTPYLIVGLKGGSAQLAAWKMRAGQVSEVPVSIGEIVPNTPPPLSDTQKVAIVLAALIAAGALIVVSLSLLPPAPAIPP
jgi:proteasome lid subunit RPN8/RPN11